MCISNTFQVVPLLPAQDLPFENQRARETGLAVAPQAGAGTKQMRADTQDSRFRGIRKLERQGHDFSGERACV